MHSSTPRLKAMILAAGLGTRLKPWTDKHPKALAMVNGKSLLQRNIEYLQQFGIDEVVVNVHHFAQQIVDALSKNKGWGSKVHISLEALQPLETGGGLLHAAHLLSDADALVLLNVDMLTNLDLATMIEYHFLHKPLATLATTNRTSTRCFLFDANNKLCGWKNLHSGEVKAGGILNGTESERAFSGLHVIDTSLLSLITQNGKFSIVETYLSLMSNYTILSFDHSDTSVIDVGKPESLAKAAEIFF